MKNVTAIANAYKNSVAMKALPEVVVEWNMNRFVGAVADNTSLSPEINNAYDPELFPVESIIEPIRPNKGINKARVGQGVISNDYRPDVVGSTNPRYYIADVDDVYNYWTSQNPSNSSTGALTNCKPQAIYNASTAVNKIVIKLENTWASPKTFSIQTTTSATPNDTTDWTTIATDSTTPSGWKGSGVIKLYWNGSSWTNSTRSDNADKSPKTQTIRGVRISVSALEGGWMLDGGGNTIATTYYAYVGGTRTLKTTDGKDAFFDLIEIAAILEVDLSSYIIDMSTELDMGNVSNLFPLGDVSTNQATVNLSNLYVSGGNWVPGLFSADNTDSPYHNYIDENAKMTGAWNYYDINTGAFIARVPEFVMYTDNWDAQDSDTVEVSLSDHSRFFNETMVKAALWENLTVPQLVWRILDSVGFNNYNIERDDTLVTEHKIPIFYTDGTKSVWEVLNDLATATQTAIYFDSLGVLQVKTRDFAFSPTDTPVATFQAVTDGTQLANIVELDQGTSFDPNYFSVTYQQTNWAADHNGQPTMQQVWTPSGDTVLRGTPLVRQLDSSETNKFYIGADDVRIWPYNGLVNIEGEIITFKGKEYIYYTGSSGNVKKVEMITNQDQYNSRNAQTPWQYRNKNGFTGGMGIVERGSWNSDTKTHYVDANGYTVNSYVNGSRKLNQAGFSYHRQDSQVLLSNIKSFKNTKDILLVSRGATTDGPMYYYGTKMRFEKGRRDNVGGIFIHNQNLSTEDCYMIQFTPNYHKAGNKTSSGGHLWLINRNGGKDILIDGVAVPIFIGRWFEVDVTYRNVNGDHNIKIWVNGKLAINETITSNKQAANGRFGMHIRGKSKVTYEYLYGISKLGDDPQDDYSYLDKVETSYFGKQWDREWVYRWKTKTRRVKKKTLKSTFRVDQMFFDDFGPYVHEIREFNVKFDPSPVQMSRLYLTNDWDTVPLEYNADPFGANFYIANTARGNAVINGSDSKSFTGNEVNQVLTVFGKALVVKDGASVISKNTDQIRRRGKIDSELSSDWIQRKSMAQDIADWMNGHFSYGNDTISLDVFGNPLIELGDVIHVNYPSKHIDDDYFVIGVNNGWDTGITTSLTCRRRVA
jgi:hypothetical protein